MQWQVDISIHDERNLVTDIVRTRALVVLNVKVTESTETLRGVEQVRAGRMLFDMVVEVRDLRKLGPALEAEEGISIGKLVAIEAIFGSLKGEGTNSVSLNTTTLFEVVKETRESNPVGWTKPAFIDWETQRVFVVLTCCRAQIHRG